jgi:hypothetical protein
LTPFPQVKKLSLYAGGDPNYSLQGVGRVLDLGKAFPSLESLLMDIVELVEYGGNELSNALQIASTSPGLKHLVLEILEVFNVIPGMSTIMFSHLEILALFTEVLS